MWTPPFQPNQMKEINADFSKRALVHSEELAWVNSPMPGVSRRPLDRVGDEVARATSIVRYAPNSHFSPHVHTGGEEFLVLAGVFQDEHGDFPAGSYIRNPPQSNHTPGSELGCIIFVKLWQFEPNDRTHVRVDTSKLEAIPHNDMPGVAVSPLYKDKYETVAIHDWSPSSTINVNAQQGLEMLVLAGGFTESGDQLQKGSWLRLPEGSNFNATTRNEGARVWIKTRHLPYAHQQIQRVQDANKS